MNYKTYLAGLVRRRKAIKALRAKDPKRWTWKRIGQRYKITAQRAQQIGVGVG